MNQGYATVLGLQEDIYTRVIKNTTLRSAPAFITRYFHDEKGEVVHLKNFHVTLLDALTDPNRKRILVLLPAGHGKTTVVSRWGPTYLFTDDPNIRIMHIMNTATDAEQNLSAIQRELEDDRSLLVQEHGPFKGKTWKTTEFHVAGRTVVAKDATFAAYGTGSNVFGHRADIVICDDILNLENSGPFVTDRTRQAIHDWFFQGVMKVPGPEGKVVVVGTVMDFRDLYHELMDPKHGFEVIRMQAILDDDTKEVLWPERFTYEFLASERESDMTSFMKRYQNIAIEESLLTYPMSDLIQCKDRSRYYGVVPKPEEGHSTLVVNAFDPTAGQTTKSKWCGFASIAYDPKQPEPRRLQIVEIQHFRAPFEDQIDFLIQKHQAYNATASIIEANGAHQYLMQSDRLRRFQASGNRVLPHYTGEHNKPDPLVGLPAMAEVIKAHLMTFPYADAEAKKWVDYVIEHEFGQHPMAATTDILMAVWFAWLFIKTSTRAGAWQRRRVLPVWARGAGRWAGR